LFVGETKPIFLQHGGARPNTSAATSEGTQYIELKVVPHRPYSPYLAPYDVWWVAALSNISNEFISHVTKFKQVRKNGFRNNLKSSTATVSEILFSAGSVVSN